jgi:hypothetical protein
MANARVIVVPLSVYRRLGANAILADVHAQLSRQNKVGSNLTPHHFISFILHVVPLFFIFAFLDLLQ